MCGIFATNQAQRWLPHIDSILRALHHRGPDASGVWHDEESDLMVVHTRLEILGLGAPGAQPMVKGGEALVYNGEIYNFRELAGKIAPPSDTELLLDLLLARGPAALSTLDGMYAFALAKPADRSLLVGRDPHGIKPLYVRRDGANGVAVASAIPALLPAHPRLGLDHAGLLEFLTFGHTTENHTSWERITKLPPGTWLHVVGGPRAEFRMGRITTPSVQDGDLDEALGTAVRSQLIADVPVGTFLSGGVDSAVITALAHISRPDIIAFTVGFPDSPGIDESARARSNAKAIGCRHLVVPATNAELVAAIPVLIREHGEPLGDPAICATKVLAHTARQEIKVALTGEGADELFGGYLRHRLAHTTSMVPRLPGVPPVARAIAQRRGDGRLGRIAEFLTRGGGAAGYAALAAGDLAVLEAAEDATLGDLASQIAAPQQLAWSSARSERAGTAARLYDLRRWLPNTYLEKTDRSTMSASLEGRVPMLSPAVVHAALRQRRPTKAPLAAAAREIVPGLEFPRRKKGLAVPLAPFHSAYVASACEAQVFVRAEFGAAVSTAVSLRAQRSPLLWFRLMSMGLFLEQVD